MNSFSIIVAMDLEKGIGKGGQLPWCLSGDMRYFKELTTKTTLRGSQNAVMMGRKTWESIPEKFRPLPGRLNIVLTRNTSLVFPKGVLRAENLEAAFQDLYLQQRGGKIESIFVIGGGEIFREAIKNPFCKKLYITQIFKQFECDTFFPEFRNDFKQISASSQSAENNFEYGFSVYERI